MYRRIVAAALLAASIASQAQAEHIHTLTCGHQFVEHQGTLEIAEGLAFKAASQSAGQKMTFILNDLGGVGQGIGQALTEKTIYDPDSGQLMSGSFLVRSRPMPPPSGMVAP
ncbi:MAG: hypothetical protein B7Z50_06590 [Sphingomonadales bacterium 12-62-5]|nr:MAG: hypothetical protein B7Z50_06590 [Sphingomonadales bacterium 12-62-5]